MIVYLDSPKGRIRLEDTGFKPVSLGKIIDNSIKRKKLTVGRVASMSGLDEEYLSRIIENVEQLDKVSARKLEKVFPHSRDIFLSVQRSYDFYRRYGVMRPDSPIKRLLIERGRMFGSKKLRSDEPAPIPLIERTSGRKAKHAPVEPA
jgi:plasmid maintenance system antidote protein VapI